VAALNKPRLFNDRDRTLSFSRNRRFFPGHSQNNTKNISPDRDGVVYHPEADLFAVLQLFAGNMLYPLQKSQVSAQYSCINTIYFRKTCK
jgi:hypothetical protein